MVRKYKGLEKAAILLMNPGGGNGGIGFS